MVALDCGFAAGVLLLREARTSLRPKLPGAEFGAELSAGADLELQDRRRRIVRLECEQAAHWTFPLL